MTTRRPRPPKKPIKTKGPKPPVQEPPDPNRSGEVNLSAMLFAHYRLWAAMPNEINGLVVFIGDKAAAAVRRPETSTWPIGVCRACGCAPGTRCQDHRGKLCTITNDPSQPCSACLKIGQRFKG